MLQFQVVVIRDSEGLVGLGLQRAPNSNALLITSMIKGSPATGLLRMVDEVTHVDSKPVAGKSVDEVCSWVNGVPGTTVVIGIRRNGAQASIVKNSTVSPITPILIPSVVVPHSTLRPPTVQNIHSAPSAPAATVQDHEVTIFRNAEGSLGIEFKKETGDVYFRVNKVHPGSPASGVLVVGDELIAADGHSLAYKAAELVGQCLRGGGYSQLTLNFRRR
mmetsp:Transcript_45570/g.121175  ORF Transcript_45570/g.121175 Transcript_45570/m.121175 type:complete len:219 (+) Transcript_45570:235-891(+)